MIICIDLETNTEEIRGPESIQSLRIENMWLELVDPDGDELAAVSERSGIPKDFLELPVTSNVINLRMEPEVQIVNFVIPREISTAIIIDPIIIAFSTSYLITVEKSSSRDMIQLAKKRMDKMKDDLPSIVAYYIMDEIVSSHFTHLERIEEQTAKIEEQVLERSDRTTLNRIFRSKSRLVSFNKMLWYERGLLFDLKKCESACVPALARGLFDSTHEYLTRQIDIVETFREIMSDAINVYLSAVSNRINSSIRNLTVVMFYLTIVTTITSFPNTVATFFGISQFGTTDQVIIYAALMLSTLLPLVWLWRSKWLKPAEQDLIET